MNLKVTITTLFSNVSMLPEFAKLVRFRFCQYFGLIIFKISFTEQLNTFFKFSKFCLFKLCARSDLSTSS